MVGMLRALRAIPVGWSIALNLVCYSHSGNWVQGISLVLVRFSVEGIGSVFNQ